MNRETTKQSTLRGTGLQSGGSAIGVYKKADHPASKALSVIAAAEMMERNAGTVVKNEGVIKVNTFHGSITANNGIVRINGGKVEINHGRIKENSDVGMVLLNCGTMTVNRGDIGENKGKVTNSDKGCVDKNVIGGYVSYGYVGEMTGGTATSCVIGQMTGGTARGEDTMIQSYQRGRVSLSIPRANITLAQGVTDADIQWVRSLPSEKAVKQVS